MLHVLLTGNASFDVAAYAKFYPCVDAKFDASACSKDMLLWLGVLFLTWLLALNTCSFDLGFFI